jgi:phosphoglycerate dehydrogenase-like enzyme
MPVALITPEEMISNPGPEAQILREAGFDVRYPADSTFTRGLGTEDETIRTLRGASALVAGGEWLMEKVFAAVPELRVVARAGVGYTDRESRGRRRTYAGVAVWRRPFDCAE